MTTNSISANKGLVVLMMHQESAEQACVERDFLLEKPQIVWAGASDNNRSAHRLAQSFLVAKSQ